MNLSEHIEYNVYPNDKLVEYLSGITDKNEEIVTFFNNFSYNKVINQNLDKGNSSQVFKNVIKDDGTKSKIILALNKLHPQNLSKIVSMIREIVFKTQDELNELVNQCIQKIKRDNEQIKPLVAALCLELLSTYFMTSTGEKIYFRKLLLTSVKNNYIESIKFTNDSWTKEYGERTMILIGVLLNNKIIDSKIMTSILNDYKKTVLFKDNESQEYYEIVEKAIHQLSCLVSSIILTSETREIYDNLDVFLENQILLYEEKKYISKKIRLVCKNCIDELRKPIT